jgi:hypothetical protein
MKELRDLSLRQGKECNSLCRKVVYAILAIAWGLMIKDGTFIAKTQGPFPWILGAIFVLSIIYLLVDAGTYYMTGAKARNLMNRLDDDHDELTQIEAIDEMNTVYDFAYGTLAYKLIACLVLVILLAIYVYKLGFYP